VIDSLTLPRGPRVEVSLISRPLLTSVAQKLCSANVVYSRAEREFFSKIASKYFAAVCEAFSNTYPDKEVGLPMKTPIRRLVRQFRETGTVCDRKHVRVQTMLAGETLLFRVTRRRLEL
jgi:hypothetical protein